MPTVSFLWLLSLWSWDNPSRFSCRITHYLMWTVQQLQALQSKNPLLGSSICAFSHVTSSSSSSLRLHSTHNGKISCRQIKAITLDDLPPNALRRKRDPQWRGGFSLGVDLGMARTGVALSKGFSVRPLTVIISWELLPFWLSVPISNFALYNLNVLRFWSFGGAFFNCCQI